MKENKTNQLINSDEYFTDYLSLLKKIWRQRKLIIKTLILFFIIGCFVALSSPIVYTAQTTFVPQISSDDISSRNNQLSSIASIAGINLQPTEVTSDSYLSPLVYENIIDSEEFSLGLLSKELSNLNGKKFTVKEYLLSKEGLFNFIPISFIKKYTIGLFLNKDSNKVDSEILKSYNFISNEDYSLIKSFRAKFGIELNPQEGFIKVFASDKNAFISSQIVDLVTTSLQSKIIEIRTIKIKERLEFSKEQYKLKQDEFDVLQKKLAEFKDSNKNISTASFRSELQKLESEYQIQQNILLNLASEYNNNKIKLNKDTPIFSVTDEVSVPNIRSKPQRSLLVIIYTFLGLVMSVGFILFKEPVINLVKEIIN